MGRYRGILKGKKLHSEHHNGCFPEVSPEFLSYGWQTGVERRGQNAITPSEKKLPFWLLELAAVSVVYTKEKIHRITTATTVPKTLTFQKYIFLRQMEMVLIFPNILKTYIYYFIRVWWATLLERCHGGCSGVEFISNFGEGRREREEGRALFMPSRKRRSGSIITKGAKAASSSAADAVGQRSRKEGFFMLFSQEYYKERRVGGRKKVEPRNIFSPLMRHFFLVFRFFLWRMTRKGGRKFSLYFLGHRRCIKMSVKKKKNFTFPLTPAQKKTFFSFLFWHLKSFWPVKNCPRKFLGQKRLVFCKIRHIPRILKIKRFFLAKTIIFPDMK